MSNSDDFQICNHVIKDAKALIAARKEVG